MKTIAVIAAHPDDEVLGCGGTLLKHAQHGDKIHLLFMTDGVSSREHTDAQQLQARKSSLETVCHKLQTTSCTTLDFPDNQLDSVPLLQLVKAIERFVAKTNPEVVYTHFQGDLNIDHALTSRAVHTACRPLPQSSIKKILSFEVPSSTEWTIDTPFLPNCYIDIADVWQEKIGLLDCYNQEMRSFPHARSYEAIKALATWRGSSVGVPFAESFIITREIG